jgi:hypothetical protein
MATRLPTPGADDGQWGNILNDFLSQAHNPDGSLKPLTQSQITNLTADLAAKASQSDLTTLQTTVQGKADTTALATKLDTTAAAATYAPRPDADLGTIYVTRKGNDANDGLSWGTAKATPEGALAAVAAISGQQHPNWAGNSARVLFGAGVFRTDGLLSVPNGLVVEGSGLSNTEIQLNDGRNCNVFQSASWGTTGTSSIDDQIMFRNIKIRGRSSTQTTTPYESVTTGSVTLTAGSPVTVPVASTTGLPTAGRVWIGDARCSYTGTTALSLTGVLLEQGSAPVVPLMSVTPFNQQGHGIALQASRCVLEDVTVQDVIGSGIAIQSSGDSSPSIAYENKLIRIRTGTCGRYGIEVGENASDGMIFQSGDGLSRFGALILRAVNWEITDCHPVGGAAFPTSATRGIITICAGIQRMKGLYIDTALHDAVVFDVQKRNRSVSDVQIDMEAFWCGGAGGAGAAFRLLGRQAAGPGVSDCRLEVRQNNGYLGWFLSNGPALTSASVGNQDWTTATKAQLTDVTSLPPDGGNIALLGSLAYTGVQVTDTTVVAATATGSTTLMVARRGNLDSAGTVSAAWSGALLGMRLSYTGITMSGSNAILTGIPTSGAGSITLDIPAAAVVSQHFLTGISGSSASSVPNNTFGDANNVSVWQMDRVHIAYEVQSNLSRGTDPIQLPSTGNSSVAAIDVNSGVGDRQVLINGLGTPKATVGTWSLLNNSSAYNSGYVQNGTSAQNDAITFYEVWLDAGTWNLDLLGLSNTDGAIVTPSLINRRGRIITIAGTQDQYGVTASAIRTALPGIIVVVSGSYSLKVTVTAKNASSSAFRARFSGAILTRTA